MRAERFVQCNESYRGVVEVPDGSNRTPIGAEFGWNGVSWCCQSQSLALCGALWVPERRIFTYDGGFWDGSKITLPGADFRRGWAAVPSIVAAFQQRGWAGRTPRYPCLIAFRWSSDPMDSHIGAAIRPGSVVTDEGNHRNRFEQWLRDETAQVWSYLYPPFSNDPTPAPVPEEDDMPTFAPVIVQPGQEAPVGVPPPHGGLGWGDVYVSFATDEDPGKAGIWIIGEKGKLFYAKDGVPVAKGRELAFRLDKGVQYVQVRNEGQRPLCVLVEADRA